MDIKNKLRHVLDFPQKGIDFIDITPIIPNFGIFNFADSCLCVGIFLLIVYEVVEMIRDDLKKKSPKKDEK